MYYFVLYCVSFIDCLYRLQYDSVFSWCSLSIWSLSIHSELARYSLDIDSIFVLYWLHINLTLVLYWLSINLTLSQYWLGIKLTFVRYWLRIKLTLSRRIGNDYSTIVREFLENGIVLAIPFTPYLPFSPRFKGICNLNQWQIPIICLSMKNGVILQCSEGK